MRVLAIATGALAGAFLTMLLSRSADPIAAGLVFAAACVAFLAVGLWLLALEVRAAQPGAAPRPAAVEAPRRERDHAR